MENNKKSLDEIYREVETDLKKGSFKGPKYEKIDIILDYSRRSRESG